MGNGYGMGRTDGCGHRIMCRPIGGPIQTVIGSIPIMVGLGCPTRLGDGPVSIMGVGFLMIVAADGFGIRILSGRLPGVPGAQAAIGSVGRLFPLRQFGIKAEDSKTEISTGSISRGIHSVFLTLTTSRIRMSGNAS